MVSSRLITDTIQQNFCNDGESSFPWQGSFQPNQWGGQIQWRGSSGAETLGDRSGWSPPKFEAGRRCLCSLQSCSHISVPGLPSPPQIAYHPVSITYFCVHVFFLIQLYSFLFFLSRESGGSTLTTDYLSYLLIIRYPRKKCLRVTWLHPHIGIILVVSYSYK